MAANDDDEGAATGGAGPWSLARSIRRRIRELAASFDELVSAGRD